MRLTSFTDYGLRVLMRLAGDPTRAFTAAALAAEFRVSRNHLAKVISPWPGRACWKPGVAGGVVRCWPARLRISVSAMSWRRSRPIRRWSNVLRPGPMPAR